MKELSYINILKTKKASVTSKSKTFEATSLVENCPQIKTLFCSDPPPPTLIYRVLNSLL